MLIIILLVSLVIAAFALITKVKKLNHGNLTLITGGVKTGKTELSVALVKKRYSKQLRKWRRAMKKAQRNSADLPEKPLLYSNMPIGKKGDTYAPITLDLMTGKKRFRYGSVVYFNEVSFIAGSKDLSDEQVNDYLLQFWKLCAHETRGGYFILDTQSPQDTHYTIKRSLSTYYHIQKRLTLPVFSILYVRENMLVDGDTTVAVDTQIDPQDGVSEGGKPWYPVFLLNKWWKYYDQYAYSSLTDHLPVEDKLARIDSQKINHLLRIKHLLKEQGMGGKRR